jgi:hypothetical protein
MRKKLVEAGQKGKCMYLLSYPYLLLTPIQTAINPQSQDPPPYTHSWIHACPLNSITCNLPASLLPRTTKPKTFIHDHFLAMDPCAHTSHLTQHGEFLSHGPRPSAYPFPVPQFSYCSSPLHADIRVPIMLSWVEDVNDGEEVWIEKEEERLLWRGLNTGIHHGKEKPWKDAQRDRLMDLVSSPSPNSCPEKRSTLHSKTIDVLLTDLHPLMVSKHSP